MEITKTNMPLQGSSCALLNKNKMFKQFLPLFFFLTIYTLFSTGHLHAANDSEQLVKGLFAEGVNIDLREPTFSDGVFTTTQGGVITGPNMRIQALHLSYTRKVVEGQPIFTLQAEGNLLVEFGDFVFVGDHLDYDFQSKSGVIYQGRTGLEPWFAGGETIRLNPDGSYIIEKGFITTDEHSEPDWQITADYALLREQRYLLAKQIRFRFRETPLFWMPTLKMDLDAIFDSPIRYSVRWGGRLGPRAGLIYEILDWNCWKVFFRFDYRLNRGPGGGIEAHYRSPDNKRAYHCINYLARDASLFNPNESTRYRFEGVYRDLLWNDQVSINLTYDKLSDKDMASDYNDKGLQLDTAERTQLDIHHQDFNWIGDLTARVRVNPFETVKEELPTLMWSMRPLALGKTGVIADSSWNISYLDFVYSNHLPNVDDYHSARIDLAQRVYRPFQYGAFTATPEMGYQSIFYGNSPAHNEKMLVLGVLGCETNVPFYRFLGQYKHVMEPYASYKYYTSPTVSPNDHYIFDIDDGWVRLNMVRFGTRQSLYKKSINGCVNRYLYADIYANAFFDVHTIPKTIPKVYTDLVWKPTDFLRYFLRTAWDFEENQVDHFNVRMQWTLSADVAFAMEYRHRDAFAWRKADQENFMVDAFHSIESMRHSQMSDRRDTLLLHGYYKFYPNWALEYTSRHGWHRKTEPSYNEFEIDLITTVYSAGQVRISYQHREGDDRVVFYFSVGLKRPDSCSIDLIPCIDF
jgi:hypothetical protein